MINSMKFVGLVLMLALTSVKCEILFEFDFDELEDITSFLGTYGNIIGVRFASAIENATYNPIVDDDDFKLILTDITSISSETSNQESCQIPFNYNDIDNYFCVENPIDEDSFQCLTTSNQMADCNQGKFYQVKPSRGINEFSSELGFFKQFELTEQEFYEIDFSYIINYHGCSSDSVLLRVYLKDESSFSEIIFDSSTETTTSSNTKWNSLKRCFQVDSGSYLLNFLAASTCNEPLAFVAVDAIYINRLEEIDDLSGCINFAITTEQTDVSLAGTVDATNSAASIQPTIHDTTTNDLEPSRTTNEETPSTTLGLSTSKMMTLESEGPVTIQQSSFSSWNPITSNNPTSTPIETTTTELRTTTTTTENDKSEPSSSFPTYLIIVISVVGVLVLAGIAGIIFYCYKRSKKNSLVIPSNNTDLSTTQV